MPFHNPRARRDHQPIDFILPRTPHNACNDYDNEVMIYDPLFFFADESTRVKLPEVDHDPLTSYINANYIRVGFIIFIAFLQLV